MKLKNAEEPCIPSSKAFWLYPNQDGMLQPRTLDECQAEFLNKELQKLNDAANFHAICAMVNQYADDTMLGIMVRKAVNLGKKSKINNEENPVSY